MKKTILSLVCLASFALSEAQSTEEALRLSLNRPAGTARNMALSGAMGALGGDYSSLLTNPAGIAVYRSSEFTFTPSLHLNNSSTEFYGLGSNDDRIGVPFQQIAFVGTFKPVREAESGLISTHFGIGYNRTNSFKRNTFIQGGGLQSSLLDEFVAQTHAGLNDRFYNGMAMDALLIRNYELPNGQPVYLHDFEYYEDPDTDAVQFGAINGLDHSRLISERGNAGDFSLSGGANFSNRFYLGGSLNISTFDYESNLTHQETLNGGLDGLSDYYIYYRVLDQWEARENFTFTEDLKTSGIGINLKVGAIFKPTASLRIGAAFHTPTFFSVDEEYATAMSSKYYELGMENGIPVMYNDWGVDSKEAFGEFSYKLRTPLKGIGSLAYTFGNKGLISLDYEYTNYSSMQYRADNSDIGEKQYFSAQNDLIKDTFKATHNLHIGAELRPTEVFTLRGGLGLMQSPYHKDHFKGDDLYRTFSGGFGYRMNNMFIDFAYILRQEKTKYSLYETAPYMENGTLETAKITNNNHQVALTLGWRF